MKAARSHLPNVQSLIKADSKFARVFTMAKANDLPKSEHGAYMDVYLNNENFDLGIATKMLADTVTWSEYLEDCRRNIADAIIGGENPRIKELGLDMSKGKGKKKQRRKEEKPMTKKTKDENVTAKEGDAFRKQVRDLCDELNWELTETGGAIAVEDDGEEVAVCKYVRGTKNNAWKSVFEQLEVLT